MKITPSWVATFETNVQTFVVDGWARAQKNLIWEKLMDVRSSSTLRELYFWLIESAKLNEEGQGGNKRYDDMIATFFEVDNTNSGNALVLTKNEIEDNMMAGPGLRGMPALDYAANWAKQIGGAGAYRPQDLLFNTLIPNGQTALGYDGVPFFSTAHPTNPGLGASAGVYSNLATGGSALPLLINSGASTGAGSLWQAAANLNTAVANMRGLKQPNGKQRFLRPRALFHDPSLQYSVTQLLDSKFYGATDNVFTRLGIEPVCVDELSSDPGAWYLAAELMPGEGGPFIFQDREPYYLTSYTADSMVELQRRKDFEWIFDGRNAGAYGHPYLISQNRPT